MKDELQKLGKALCSWKEIPEIASSDWQKIVEKTTVVLMAGGESSRFREVPGSEKSHKTAFQLPNGDTMVEMTIRMYREAGIKRFVALVRDNSESLIDLLGHGENLDVAIDYSEDPTPLAGRGGAMRNAYDNGKFSDENYLIVHNPDDLIFDFQGSFPQHVLGTHIENEKSGAIASMIVCEGTPYTYSAMEIKDNRIVESEYQPFVPLPTHIGVTIYSAGLKKLFMESFDYTQKADFENKLGPRLAKEGKLFAVGIPYKTWLPVNNLKNYKQLLTKLGLS